MVALGMSFSKLLVVELSLLNYEFLTSSLLTTFLIFSNPEEQFATSQHPNILLLGPINLMFISLLNQSIQCF